MRQLALSGRSQAACVRAARRGTRAAGAVRCARRDRGRRASAWIFALGLACGGGRDDGALDVADATADADATSDDETSSTECGWGEVDGLYVYACGGMGADPTGAYPLSCGANASEGTECGAAGVDGVGCCLDPMTLLYCTSEGVVTAATCMGS